MSVQGDKVSFGNAGTYSGAVEVGITPDGQEIWFTDAVTGYRTMAQLLGHVASHNIGDHGNMSSDFATQYYNATRLGAFLADGANGNNIGVSADVGGGASLGAHVMNPAVHQRVPKFVLRVAKGGQQFATIGAALAAVPTSGPDKPSPDRWWRIEVSPGVYNETVLIDKQWVEVVGAGTESTRIVWDNAAAPGTWPVFVAVDNVALRGLGIESINPAFGTNAALQVGASGGPGGLKAITVRDCYLVSPGEYAAWVSAFNLPFFERCSIRAENGSGVRADGHPQFNDCYFLQSKTGFAESGVDVLGSASFFNCRTDVPLMTMVDGTATVNGCWGRNTGELAREGMANVNSAVYWDGLGFSAAYINTGSLKIYKGSDGGILTQENVDFNWPIPIEMAVQKHFWAGHEGTSLYESASEFGDGGPDFHFYRKVIMDSAALVGDVAVIGDDSGSPGGNSANALALYLGSGNDSGKYLRWLDGPPGVGAELGFIDHDGVVHAPGFVGDGSGLTGKQNADSDLDALAGLSSTGLIARTGTGAAAVRTLTGTSNLITVTNGNGVSGNPTVTVGANVARRDVANTFVGETVFGSRLYENRVQLLPGTHTIDGTYQFYDVNLSGGTGTFNLPLASTLTKSGKALAFWVLITGAATSGAVTFTANVADYGILARGAWGSSKTYTPLAGNGDLFFVRLNSDGWWIVLKI